VPLARLGPVATRRLIIVRHAKAKASESWLPDEQRELSDAGRKQAEGVGKQIASTGMVVQMALVSSAKRTRQTWKLLASKAKLKACPVQVRDDLYGASVADMVKAIRELPPEVRTAIIVGHEPTVAATSSYLAGPKSDEAALAQVKVGVPTAAWAVLDSHDEWADWGRGRARLRGVHRP